MTNSYIISFEGGNVPAFQQLFERCVDLGLATTEDGRTDIAKEYVVDGDQKGNADINTALEELSGSGAGRLSVWADTQIKLRVYATNNPNADSTELHNSAAIGFATKWFDTRTWSEETINEHIEAILSLVTEMVPLVSPEFVWSGIIDETTVPHRKPSGRPIRDNIDQLGWVTVLSEGVVEQFGGREHVLATPAWRTTEFDTGHILLVLGEDPFDSDAKLACKEHLLGD